MQASIAAFSSLLLLLFLLNSWKASSLLHVMGVDDIPGQDHHCHVYTSRCPGQTSWPCSVVGRYWTVLDGVDASKPLTNNIAAVEKMRDIKKMDEIVR